MTAERPQIRDSGRFAFACGRFGGYDDAEGSVMSGGLT